MTTMETFKIPVSVIESELGKRDLMIIQLQIRVAELERVIDDLGAGDRNDERVGDGMV